MWFQMETAYFMLPFCSTGHDWESCVATILPQALENFHSVELLYDKSKDTFWSYCLQHNAQDSIPLPQLSAKIIIYHTHTHTHIHWTHTLMHTDTHTHNTTHTPNLQVPANIPSFINSDMWSWMTYMGSVQIQQYPLNQISSSSILVAIQCHLI